MRRVRSRTRSQQRAIKSMVSQPRSDKKGLAEGWKALIKESPRGSNTPRNRHGLALYWSEDLVALRPISTAIPSRLLPTQCSQSRDMRVNLCNSRRLDDRLGRLVWLQRNVIFRLVIAMVRGVCLVSHVRTLSREVWRNRHLPACGGRKRQSPEFRQPRHIRRPTARR